MSLLLVAALSIIVLLILITWVKWHPFVSLIITAIGLGLVAGMPLSDIIKSLKEGMGNTLGFIATVLALGTMLGKMMAESCGAEQIANTLIRRFGRRRVHWAMMAVAFLTGIPVFFQVGFVLLIPLVFTVAAETGISLVTIGIPLVAGLSVVHGLVPPHPAAMAAVDLYHADVGKTIFYALLVGLPAAAVAGPLYGQWIGKRIHKSVPEKMANSFSVRSREGNLPGFANTLFTILLPVILMLVATLAEIFLPKSGVLHSVLTFIGDPIVSLLIATLYAFFSLGTLQGTNRETIQRWANDCLAPTASILLVIGGGGAFNKVLIDSGVGQAVAQLAAKSHLSPILLAWVIAAAIRVATGSATVSMLTAAGIVAPIAQAVPGTSPELLVLATGAGSITLSHVNDSGFWMIKEYFGMSLKETFWTWTAAETLLSVVALPLILLLNGIV
jgi:GntP family gluconate:H+ symporter